LPASSKDSRRARRLIWRSGGTILFDVQTAGVVTRLALYAVAYVKRRSGPAGTGISAGRVTTEADSTLFRRLPNAAEPGDVLRLGLMQRGPCVVVFAYVLKGTWFAGICRAVAFQADASADIVGDSGELG
jgi:hypothetical protein